MPRPIKNTVSYFPHYVNHGKTLFTLESNFGNDGYSFLFKLLELLGKTNDHYIDCRDIKEWKYLLALTRIEDNKAKEMMIILSEYGTIDKELWNHMIIYSENFISNLKPLYERRKQSCLSKSSIMDLLTIEKDKRKFESNSPCLIHNKKIEFIDEYIVLSKKLFQGITMNVKSIAEKYKITDPLNIDFKNKTIFEIIIKWYKTIILMIKIDNRTYTNIDCLISFTYGIKYKDIIMKDDFWSTTCQSAYSLRKNYDKIHGSIQKMIKNKEKGVGVLDLSNI